MYVMRIRFEKSGFPLLIMGRVSFSGSSILTVPQIDNIAL